MEPKVCLNCKGDLSHRDSRAKYCSAKCLNAPRFYGKFCNWCGKDLIVSKANQKLTKFCSRRCVFLSRHPDLNEDYFAEPNLENSYWAGFIAADGCISSKNSRWQDQLSIMLKETDSEHLEILRSVIGGGDIYYSSNLDARTKNRYFRVDYRIVSDKICLDLFKNFNITKRKTSTHMPPNLSGKLAHAFIAGYVDGDGSYTHGANRPRLSIAGTFNFLTWVSGIYGLNKIPKGNATKSIFYIEFSGDDAINVRRSFKKLNLPLLERKKNRWEELGLDLKVKSIS